MPSNYYSRVTKTKGIRHHVRYRRSSKESWISAGSYSMEAEAQIKVKTLNDLEQAGAFEKIYEILNDDTDKFDIHGAMQKSNKKFGEVAQELLRYKKNLVTTQTYSGYRTLLNSPDLVLLNDVKLSDFNRDQGIEWIEKINGNNTTKSNKIKMVKRVMNYAIEMGYIAVKGWDKYVAVREERSNLSMVIWSPEVYELYLDHIKVTEPRWFALFNLEARTGLRRGELVGLQIDDVDIFGKKITVKRSISGYNKKDGWLISDTKTVQSARTISLSSETAAILQAHIDQQARWLKREYKTEQHPTHPLFCGSGPIWLKPERVTDAHNRFQESFAEVSSEYLPKTTFHDLRDTWACHALEAGINVVVVSHRMGHADVTTTLQRYAHVTPRLDYGTAEIVEAYQKGTVPELEKPVIKFELPAFNQELRENGNWGT